MGEIIVFDLNIQNYCKSYQMFRKQKSIIPLFVVALVICLGQATLSVYNWQTLEESD